MTTHKIALNIVSESASKDVVAALQHLIGCAANLVLQGGVKSADGEAVRFGASSVVFAAVRCTAG